MTVQRRRLLGSATAFTLVGLAGRATAQPTWPVSPVKWIVPFPPAGAMDVIARTLAEQMGRQLGQTFVIENRPGAGGNIGADAVARSPADGSTMMIVANGQAVNRYLYRRLSYDPVKDFAPVSLVAVVPNVLVVSAANPARSVADVIRQAQANPGKLSYASAGNGTSIHLAGELFASMAKLDLLHVPYKGSGPAVTDLIGGQVDMMFDSITSARPHIESGRLRALGVTTSRRSAALPEVPTIAEAGLPGYDLSPWFAVFVPAGTPQPVVDKMNAALLAAMKQPEVKARFAVIGAEPIGSSPQQLAAHLKAEMDKWGAVIAERGIRAD
ncbi:tripartite tricarboxylate transporter substrate binding protein [Aquincola tertiaricarbonis]|uniref:Tripartite tricarboxylate transporter substrate binding protein n=1 Tax=Aquincola tertiaricarbonis TaxID=391953 RepID=A0ABY4S4G1_AQUTE|nr:tripartite tricarboxylate transporter substrate binding protein [Aquincola tertiaricarbonis]URI08326.1 tripartite tricarboxylate transporter substrate binding protein [Aquincola tertiaricarbonis]